jgi:hypothetical protein
MKTVQPIFIVGIESTQPVRLTPTRLLDHNAV